MSKECIVDQIHCNICLNNPTYIYQIDLESGPYIISQPGLYILMENIKTNFFKTKSSALQFNNNDKFGHSAAIKIQCNNVILNLNGYYISQSPQDYCVQRFFAIIQLNDMPFNPNVGPITVQTQQTLKTANNCIIKNGVIGLSSHQSILGNNNSNIIIENVQCEDFEVSGIILNNVKNVYIDNCSIGQSLGLNRFVPLTPFFAGLTFNHKLLSCILDNNNILKTPTETNIINTIINTLNSVLNPILNIIYLYTTLSEIFNHLLQLYNNNSTNPDIYLLINPSGLSPCNIHGIKITGKNPSIGPFHISTGEINLNDYSSNININGTVIKDLLAKIDEKVILTENNEIIHVGAGLKATDTFINTDIGKILMNNIYNLINTNQTIRNLVKTNISLNVINFINYNVNSGTIGFKRSMDIMGHINKGVIGIRVGLNQTTCINNVKIYNIENKGSELSTLELNTIITKYDGINIVPTMDTTFLSPLLYTGSYAVGFIISGSNDIHTNCIDTRNIFSPNGCAVGCAVNNMCNNIVLNNVYIGNLLSCDTCNDSTTLLIDYKAKCVKLDNITIN